MAFSGVGDWIGDGGTSIGIFVRDLTAGRTILVSANLKGAAGNNYSDNGRLSADGRYVAFSCDDTDLVAKDANGYTDAFVRDLKTGKTTAVSTTATGKTGNLGSFYPVPSGDAGRILFESNATNLGVNPGDGKGHLFVRCLPNR